jgi:hypothetical protein
MSGGSGAAVAEEATTGAGGRWLTWSFKVMVVPQ